MDLSNIFNVAGIRKRDDIDIVPYTPSWDNLLWDESRNRTDKIQYVLKRAADPHIFFHSILAAKVWIWARSLAVKWKKAKD